MVLGTALTLKASRSRAWWVREGLLVYECIQPAVSALCRGPLLQLSTLKYLLSYSPADTARLDINASHHVLDHPRHRPQPLCPCQTQRVGG